MKQNENTPPTDIIHSLQIINRFLDNFSPEEVKRISWDLLICAIGSEDANGLTNIERSDMLFFYEQVNKVCEALVVIDRGWSEKYKI